MKQSREQTLRGCIDTCRHSARLCTQASAVTPRPQQDTLLRCAQACEEIAGKLASGLPPSADAFRQCAELCSQCARWCEAHDAHAECADACRSGAQLCLMMAAVP